MKFPKGVMFMDKFGDESIWYRISCDCGSKDCDTYMEFEFDKRLNMLFLNFHKDVIVAEPYDDTENIIDKMERYWKRFCKSMRLLFTGYLKMEESFNLQDEEHINNFIDALHEGRDYILEGRKKNEEKRNGTD